MKMKTFFTTITLVLIFEICLAGTTTDKIAYSLGKIFGWIIIISLVAIAIKSLIKKERK